MPLDEAIDVPDTLCAILRRKTSRICLAQRQFKGKLAMKGRRHLGAEAGSFKMGAV